MRTERFVDNTLNNKNKLRERASYIVACGSLALLATLTGCDTTTPTPPVTNTLDRDGDGIINIKDRQPDITDSSDVDGDGIPNSKDALYPYDPANGGGIIDTTPIPDTTSVPVPIPKAPNNIQPCIRYTKPDSDGDGIPDHCDHVYNSKDSDGDGLYDYEDTAPYTRDRDNDGLLDGQDREPEFNQKREQEKRDTERREEQRLEEKRLEEQRQRDRDGY